MEDQYRSDEYVMPDILRMADLCQEKSPRLAKTIRKNFERRQQTNWLAIEIIEDKGIDLCGSLCSIYAEENEAIVLAIEMGWAVDQFSGIASIFNRLSARAVEEGRADTAVMYRVFAIAVNAIGVEKVGSEEFDSILRRTYNGKLRFPTEELWDQAHARMVLEETETEAIWQKVKEGEYDDELD
jgi:hypothetical protein